MDDLEFRRRAYAEPDCQDDKFLAKKNASKESKTFVGDLQAFNYQIKDAMNTPVPEGLAERIILNQTLVQHAQKKQGVKVIFSLVASVSIVFALVFTFLFTSNIDLEQEVFAHIYEELNHLNEQQHNDIHHVNNLLKSFGGTVNIEIGEVNYLGSCNIANKKGVHMVLAGEKGPVTIMMLPNINIGNKQSISDGRFKGSIIPATKGSIVIVGEKGESLEEIRHKLVNNIRWVI
jgi:Protein of unknown function (DUF3379)